MVKFKMLLPSTMSLAIKFYILSCKSPCFINSGNKKIIALYGHVGEMLVGEGDLVTRGQLIAHLGNNQDNFECIWGVRHLHFQIGQKYRDRSNKGNYWGHSYFLEDGKRAMNPHLYWANGPNVVTCYEPNKQYNNGTITYPVPCK